jgi:cysteine desulfuration protein SufE
MSSLPNRLNEIVEEFALCVGQEKLEYLLYYAEQYEPLPDWLAGKRDEMEQVHECMTPVFIHVEQKDGRLTYYFDVPPESPTVRGFASFLSQGINGSTPAEVAAIPEAFYLETGLNQVLSPQRLNGLSAILAYMKRLALQL